MSRPVGGHARRPAFPFTFRAPSDQLVCDARSYIRAYRADGRALHAPMLAWTVGPLAIGETGDNSLESLISGRWLVQVCPDGSWVLYQEEGGLLTVTPWDDPPAFAGPDARHPSVAFDQAARAVLAWEEDDIILVRRWDPVQNEYIENVSFSGHDPCLAFDATWSYHVPSSDVLLFYLSSDRERLMCRVQRDVYAVEHLIWDFEEPSVLDSTVDLPYRYELLVSDQHGNPRANVLVSHLYPVHVEDLATMSFTGPRGGSLDLVVLQQLLEDDLEAAFSGPRGGSLVLVVKVEDVGMDAADFAFSGPRGGALVLVVKTETVGPDALDAGFTGPRGGELKLVVLEIILTSDAITASFSGPRGGSLLEP